MIRYMETLMSLIPLETFCELYDVSKESVYVALSTGTSGLGEFAIKRGQSIYVDEAAYKKAVFARMDKFKFAQKIYYPCVDLVGSTLALARICAEVTGRTTKTWNSFFQKSLFIWANEEISRYTTPVMIEEFMWVGMCIVVLGKKRGLINYKDYLLEM